MPPNQPIMERLEYGRYGGPEVVHLAAFTLPDPAPDQVVVRVAASSINPMDWKIRNGELKILTGSKFPRAMGTDFSGIVHTVGSKVSQFKPGDAVLGTTSMKASGAFAPMVITSQKLVVKKPENLSFPEAACLPIAAVTAWLALVKNARLKPGQQVFINGAMGSVGLAAGEIVRAIGAQLAGRVGPKSIAQAQSLGISPALDYTKPLPSSLKYAFDVVFDCNGSLLPQESKSLIKRGGKVIDIVGNGRKMLRSLTSSWYKLVNSDPKAENLQEVVDLAAAGKLAIPIARTISLADTPALLASLEKGERLTGKVIIAFD
jgi:NADPH:quinone reductase-like Zn-dependent oxidoreductase